RSERAIRWTRAHHARYDQRRSPSTIASASGARSAATSSGRSSVNYIRGPEMAPDTPNLRRAPGNPARASGQLKLLLDQDQVGRDQDLVRELEDQELRHLHVVARELGVELHLHAQVVLGEAEALLLLGLLRGELDVGHAALGHPVDGLAAHRERPADLRR